jgi:hypothetical protein
LLECCNTVGPWQPPKNTVIIQQKDLSSKGALDFQENERSIYKKTLYMNPWSKFPSLDWQNDEKNIMKPGGILAYWLKNAKDNICRI